MNLSKNLTLAEVTKSATANRLKINNEEMTDDIMENIKAVAKHIFQPTRDHLGPIRVSSGYRSPALNKAIGGAASSQHSKGEALDLQGIKATNRDLFYFIKDGLDFDQIIWEFGDNEEPDWVHVSYKHGGENRRMALVSKKVNGKTTYEAWS